MCYTQSTASGSISKRHNRPIQPPHVSVLPILQSEESIPKASSLTQDWLDILDCIVKYSIGIRRPILKHGFTRIPNFHCPLHPARSITSHKSSKKTDDTYHSDICENWNNFKCIVKEKTGCDCIHRRFCNSCQKEDYRAPNCLTNSVKQISRKH